MANEKRVIANLLPVLTLTADFDPSTDTVIEASELADWPVIGSTNHMAVTIDRDGSDPYILYITEHESGATVATVDPVGQEGTTAVAASAGAKCSHGLTVRDQLRVGVGSFQQATDLNLNSTAWADIDAGLEASIPAWPGDVVVASINAMFNAASVDLRMDVKVTTASSTTYMTTATEGTPGAGGSFWWAPGGTIHRVVPGLIHRIVQADDLTAGMFTGRVRYRTYTGSNKLMYVDQDDGHLALFQLIGTPQYEAPTF